MWYASCMPSLKHLVGKPFCALIGEEKVPFGTVERVEHRGDRLYLSIKVTDKDLKRLLERPE